MAPVCVTLFADAFVQRHFRLDAVVAVAGPACWKHAAPLAGGRARHPCHTPGPRGAGSGLAPGARSALWGSGRAAQGLSSTYAEAEARAPTSAGIGQPELFRARPPLCSLPRLGLRAAGGRGRGNSGGVSRVSNDESRVWSNRVYIALAQHTPLSRVSAYRTQRSSIFITRVAPHCVISFYLSAYSKSVKIRFT